MMSACVSAAAALRACRVSIRASRGVVMLAEGTDNPKQRTKTSQEYGNMLTMFSRQENTLAMCFGCLKVIFLWEYRTLIAHRGWNPASRGNHSRKHFFDNAINIVRLPLC
jgi:hypothetical protein